MNRQYRRPPWSGLRRFGAGLLAVVGVHWLTACSTVDYYAQAAQGHLALMQQREPIDALLADPSRDAHLFTKNIFLTCPFVLKPDSADFISLKSPLPNPFKKIP